MKTLLCLVGLFPLAALSAYVVEKEEVVEPAPVVEEKIECDHHHHWWHHDDVEVKIK